jgi:hypothetical protein
MIKGNAFDTFTIVFDNGEKFSLMATNETMATMMAQQLNPVPKIIKVIQHEEW